MRRWWWILAWAPLASATEVWVKQQDPLGRALAQQFLPTLSQALDQPLTLRLADDDRDLRHQVLSRQGIGWGHVTSANAALYEVQTAVVSRQDFSLDGPQGRMGYAAAAPWMAELKLRYPNVTWVPYRTPNTGVLGVVTAEVDGFVGTLPNISASISQLQLNSLTLNPLPYPAQMGLFVAPDHPSTETLTASLATLKPQVQQAAHAYFKPLQPQAAQPWAWWVAGGAGALWLMTLFAWLMSRGRTFDPSPLPTVQVTPPGPATDEREQRSQAYLNQVNQQLQNEVAQRLAKEAELLKVQQALNQAQNRLEQQVRTDALTKLANRRHFDEQLSKEWRRHCREQVPMSLVLMDIDYFKKYNDTLGHPAGDECLRQVAGILADSFNRSGDLVARYGGEEFIVLLSHCSVAEATAQVERMQKRMQAAALSHPASEISDQVTLSMGIASCVPILDDDPWGLVEEADQGLYQAKIQGRNQYRVAAA